MPKQKYFAHYANDVTETYRFINRNKDLLYQLALRQYSIHNADTTLSVNENSDESSENTDITVDSEIMTAAMNASSQTDLQFVHSSSPSSPSHKTAVSTITSDSQQAQHTSIQSPQLSQLPQQQPQSQQLAAQYSHNSCNSRQQLNINSNCQLNIQQSKRTTAIFSQREHSIVLGCLDFGMKKTGIALLDTEVATAYPLSNIKMTGSLKKDTTSLMQIVQRYNLFGLVIGSSGSPHLLNIKPPIHESDLLAANDYFCRFIHELVQHIPVAFFDERFTTAMANTLLKTFDIKRKKRNAIDDGIAACIMLSEFHQRFLSSHNVDALAKYLN